MQRHGHSLHMKSCCLNSRICYRPFGLYIFPQGLLRQPLFCYGDEKMHAFMRCIWRPLIRDKMCRAPSCLCASLLTQSGRGEKLASGKTHDVGVGREKQARKPTLEAYCWVAGRKVGVERKWQAEKPTAWVQTEKSKQENPDWNHSGNRKSVYGL